MYWTEACASPVKPVYVLLMWEDMTEYFSRQLLAVHNNAWDEKLDLVSLTTTMLCSHKNNLLNMEQLKFYFCLLCSCAAVHTKSRLNA